MADDANRILVNYNRGLFDRLDEFFVRATGMHAEEFSSIELFGNVIRSKAHNIAPRGQSAFAWMDKEVRSWHTNEGVNAFKAARQIGGMKLLLGGSSRFTEKELKSVSASVLYSDTVMIPDPVMPWLEKHRIEEKFHDVLLLQAVHAILLLKPLIDADLPYPAVLVFPSWEKLLEEHDQQTQEGISRLVTDVLSYHFKESWTSLDEIHDYIKRYPDKFIAIVEKDNIFVGPQGDIGESLAESMKRYLEFIKTWRSKEWCSQFESFPRRIQVFYAIMERLSPFYHFLENAQELRGHPLMSLEQHAHYFSLISKAYNGKLESLGIVQSKTKILVDTLGAKRLSWIGDIPVKSIVELREQNENKIFRDRLTSAIERLRDTDFENIERSTTEICHEIGCLVAEYDKQQSRLLEKYGRIHGQTAALAIGATVTAFIPALAPVIGSVAPLALLAKYGSDKFSDLREKKVLSQSLIGVLAQARK